MTGAEARSLAQSEYTTTVIDYLASIEREFNGALGWRTVAAQRLNTTCAAVSDVLNGRTKSIRALAARVRLVTSGAEVPRYLPRQETPRPIRKHRKMQRAKSAARSALSLVPQNAAPRPAAAAPIVDSVAAPDAEFAAMRALVNLDGAARERVIAWAVSRWAVQS